jgi:hypothetical protein
MFSGFPDPHPVPLARGEEPHPDAYQMSRIPITARNLSYRRVHKFLIVPEDFSMGGGELTPTMKVGGWDS